MRECAAATPIVGGADLPLPEPALGGHREPPAEPRLHLAIDRPDEDATHVDDYLRGTNLTLATLDGGLILIMCEQMTELGDGNPLVTAKCRMTFWVSGRWMKEVAARSPRTVLSTLRNSRYQSPS